MAKKLRGRPLDEDGKIEFEKSVEPADPGGLAVISDFIMNQPLDKEKTMTYEAQPLNLFGIMCQEASTLSGDRYIACGVQSEALIWHERDKRVYPMCKACAWHNLRNRGGRLLAGDRRLLK